MEPTSELPSTWQETSRSLRQGVRRWMSRYPSVYVPLTRPRHTDPIVDERTDVVIDGFMRSAGTFAVVGFQLAQNGRVRVAHHVHAAAHLIAAARLGTPTLLTVREPESTFVSNLLWDPLLTPRQCLTLYAEFYERLLPFRDRFVVATFDEVTSDLGAVIRRVNERSGTSFVEFEHTDENVASCFRIIEERQAGPPWAPVARAFLAGEISADDYVRLTQDYRRERDRHLERLSERRVPRPSAERTIAGREVLAAYHAPEMAGLRRRAERAYATFLAAGKPAKLRRDAPSSPGRRLPRADDVDAPVFILSSGRSGSTRLMDIIAYHDAFAWPSQYNDRWPAMPQVSVLSRVADVPAFNSSLKYRRGVPKPTEPYELWNSVFPGFAEPFRDLTADDVTPRVRDMFRRQVADIVRYQGKDRFIAKYTGWSRIEFLRQIFPDARFIHIVRDGRAVAHSYLTVPWWRGWEGIYRWQWGLPNRETLDRLARYDQSFLGLAAVNWLMLVENIDQKGRALPDDAFLTVRYEDLVADPRGEIARCIEFCGLGIDARFERHLSTIDLVDANRRMHRIPPWSADLTPRQVHMLNDVLGDALVWFGYAGDVYERAS
jgi:sulfotransferase family protein